MNKSLNNTFDSQTLASDLYEVQRIYANVFSGLTAGDWERPAQRGQRDWNLPETVAHPPTPPPRLESMYAELWMKSRP